MRIDFHSHILPGIDDGAANLEQSLKMLDMLKADGVEVVVATPHLYLHKEDVDSFIEKRNKSAALLQDAIAGKNYPKIVLGAEVYFSTALTEIPSQQLCIEGTNYMLVELPYQSFSSTFLNSFSDFVNFSEHSIILAHIERYFEFAPKNDLNSVLSNDLLAQFNCDSLEKMSDRRKTLKLIKSKAVHLMGTDAHHSEKRPPLFKNAELCIKKKLGEDVFNKFMYVSEMVLKNKSINDILSY